MSISTPEAKARETWFTIYQEVGSVRKAARKCGISRSTLQRWLKRQGQEDVIDCSRRPNWLARQIYEEDTENLILEVRDTYRYGKLRISSHLFQHHQIKIAPSTVAGILKKHDRGPLRRFRK
jgi:transposase